MAKKINGTAIPKEYAATLKSCGITAKTVEEANPLIQKKLASYDIDLNVEEEDFDFVVQMLETMCTDAAETSGGDDEVEEEDDADEKTAEEEPEEEETDDEEEDESFSEEGVEELANEIAEEETADDEEPEEDTPPAKTDSKASKDKTTAKAEKPAKDVKSGKNKMRIDPKNNEEDRAYFDPLKKLFPEKDFQWDYVSSAGVTVKHKGANSKRGMFLIENCSVDGKKIVGCNLYMNTFGKEEKQEKLREAGFGDFSIAWNGLPFYKRLSIDDVVDIVKSMKEEMLSMVQTIDKRLGTNRQRMEESLSKDKKTTKTDDKPAKSAKTKTAKKDPLLKMDRSGLKSYIKANGLDIKVYKNWDDERIREEIRKAQSK